MDTEKIESVLRGVGADRVRGRAGKVTCCCLLARWTHSSGKDGHPSMVVYVDGDKGPTYGCMACHETGTLIDLLLFLRSKFRERSELVEWIQVLDGERPVSSAKISDRMFERRKAASVEQVDSPARTLARDAHAVEVTSVGHGDDRPFYDYKAVAEADNLEEIPASVYAPYLGDPPVYALERGISEEACRAFELGDDKSMKRMLFPVKDRNNRLVAISGRLYATSCLRCGGNWIRRCDACGETEEDHTESDGDLLCSEGGRFKPQAEECIKCGVLKPPKYLHSKGFKRNLVLYGEHMRDSTEDGRVYLCEGNIDVIKLWQHGYRPVVALLGSAPGDAQIEKIIRRWKRVLIIGDGDKAGLEMTFVVKKKIADRIRSKVFTLDDGRDPADMTAEELAAKLGPPPTLRNA